MKSAAEDPPLDDDVPAAAALAAEQIRYFHKENVAGTFIGALGVSLIVWSNAAHAPAWTWLPGLLLLWVVTAIRGHLYWQYWRQPQSRAPAAWGRAHTLGAAVAGVCWGFTHTALSIHLPLENQLLIVAVASISAAYAAAAGFAYNPPAKWFIVISLTPLAFWFYASGGRLQLTLALLLTLYIPLLLRQMQHRSQALSESIQLRFSNEALARELARQKQIAEAAAQSKSRFLAVASHDLRQPMQALTIYQELLRSEMSMTAKGQDYYERLLQATAAVSDLLSHLLDISRLDAGAVQVERQPFPLSDLFEQLRNEFGHAAQQKGLELRFARCHAVIDSDPLLLGQILRNLLANAIRYTPSGKILVGCRRHDGTARIEVRDTGIGIVPDQQEAIFTEFYQIKNPQRDQQQGLGLGLAIVSRLARMLGTRVRVSSRPGQGSCFALAQPLGPGQPAEASLTAPAPLAGLRGKWVVLVENEDIVRDSLRTLLESLGCRVVSGASSQAVMRQLTPSAPAVDIVISDYGISDEENGLDVIDKLRRHLDPGFQALLITGNTSPAIVQRAGQARLPILHKPVSPSALKDALLALPGITARR